MNNNGLIEYKESFITKIRKFFKRIFGKKDNQDSSIQEQINVNISESVNEEKKDSFKTELIVDDKNINNIIEKKNFLQEIEGNEEKLNMLSIDRLQKLEKYYDNIFLSSLVPVIRIYIIYFIIKIHKENLGKKY